MFNHFFTIPAGLVFGVESPLELQCDRSLDEGANLRLVGQDVGSLTYCEITPSDARALLKLLGHFGVGADELAAEIPSMAGVCRLAAE